MDSETWLEKATRLQRALVRPGHAPGDDGDEVAARDRIKIALWLRREFEDAPDHGENVVRFIAGE